MAAVLRAADLTGDDLGALLRDVRFPAEEVRAWLDGSDGWSLSYWGGTGGTALWYAQGRDVEEVNVAVVWPRLVGGRLFCPSGELRWRRLPALGAAAYRTVYLGAELPGLDALTPRPGDLKDLQAVKGEHPLWGLLAKGKQAREGEPDAWVELRVPHRFRYPVHNFDRSWKKVAVKAAVETWRDDEGAPHFVRLCDLIAYPVE